jgi:hypothetical protein
MTGSTHNYLNLNKTGLVTYKLSPLKIQGFSDGITNESILISIERNKCANEILHRPRIFGRCRGLVKRIIFAPNRVSWNFSDHQQGAHVWVQPSEAAFLPPVPQGQSPCWMPGTRGTII